jgi:superfamily I DNA/RNA helicase
VSFLDDLNPQQREAVETADGPILILAGAGSGKTRVITYRIAHLIENLGVQPESILAVTFTNKAAQEMAERVEHLVGGAFAKPWISTFHSMCVRMLRRDIEALKVNNVGYRKDFAIYDEADQQSLVKAAIRRLGLDDKQLTPRSVLARISWAKNHMLDPQETFLQSSDLKSEQVAHVYEIYRQELRKANAMDFDDLLLETVRLLKVAEPVRHYWNRRFQYILIDEYQDTNRPQYELMRLLAGERHNICAVGDEDQSIYSWRGADIRNILEFEKDFGDAKIIRLEQNYRSTQNILSAASAVVANNVKRKGKNLWTSRQGGNRIGYYEAPDGENEALFAADLFSKYLQQSAQEGNDRARAAVLYRTNAQSRLFEEAMRRYQLPYHVVGGFSFYERAEIKDMISYLKVVQNPDDSIALMRVINTPVRGIGRTTLDTLERIGLETGTSLWGAIGNAIDGVLVPPRAVASLKNFRDIIEGGRAMLAGSYAQWLGDSVDESQSEFDQRFMPQTRRPTVEPVVEETTTIPVAPVTDDRLDVRIERLRKKVDDLKEEVARLRIMGWSLVGILHHIGGTVCSDMYGERVPDEMRELGPDCQHCNEKKRRKDTFILRNEAGEHKQVGRTCLQKFFEGQKPVAFIRLSKAILELSQELERKEPIISKPSIVETAPERTTDAPVSDEDEDISFDPEEFDKSEPRTATTGELLKFLLDRTGYIKALENEDTPESLSRVENLRELVNAAMDSHDRGEGLDEFLDHAALVSDQDQYDAAAKITLMTLHSAKGLEFPLVFLAGMEEGLFPHSRTFLSPDDVEEERRLCYVGMTRAMDQLIVSRAHYRRRYGTDMPEASIASRFLEEIPPHLLADLGDLWRSAWSETGRVAQAPGVAHAPSRVDSDDDYSSSHYDYESEDQRPAYPRRQRAASSNSHPTYNSIDNIAEFFASRGKKWSGPAGVSPSASLRTGSAGARTRHPDPERREGEGSPATPGRTGFRPGQRVKHPKYGEGTVYKREGDGDDAKITVQFPRFGLKKLVEKYAQLERV